MQSLEKISNKLKNIPYINYGGCGIAAYSILKYLKTYNQEALKSISVIFCYEDYLLSIYKTNKLLLTTKKEGFSIPTHIIIKIGKDKYYDAEGFNPYIDYVKWTHTLPKTKELSILLSIINNPRNSHWNPCFNRKKNIPKIEKALKIDLSEIRR
jgi:hypothetical protein